MNFNFMRVIARKFTSLRLATPLLTSLIVFCAVFFSSSNTLPVAAQNNQQEQQPQAAQPQQPQSQQTPQGQQPMPTIDINSIVARPVPERSSGVESGKIVKWTRRDAILAALDKNISIDVQRESVRLAQYALISAQGYYDPTVTSTMLYQSASNPTASRFTGLQGQNETSITQQALTYNYGAIQNLERWGSTINANFNNSRITSNNSNLDTQYAPSLNFTLTQPLFKNFQIDQARLNIKLAKKNLDYSDAQFRQIVIDTILAVEQAYWQLALARRQEDVLRQNVQLAETFLNNTRRQVEVGTGAPIDLVQAAAQLEQDRLNVYSQMNSVATAENTLKNLCVGGENDDLWSAVIDPVEAFDIKPVSIPVPDAIKVAFENRPEIRQMMVQKDINKINTDFYRNQVKPQINFIASYSTAGLGGTPSITTGPNCTPFGNVVNGQFVPTLVNGQEVCTSVVPVLNGNTFTPAVQTVPFNPSVSTPSPITDQFIGGYGTALGNMFKNEFRTWSVGVQFNLPLRNRTAKANLGTALETGRQIDLQTRQLMQNIEVDVRNAIQQVETARMQIDAAKAAERYAEEQYQGENKRFEAGLSTSYFVLTYQQQLASARLTTLQNEAAYNQAIATLQRVMSTTLSTYGIDVPKDTPVSIK